MHVYCHSATGNLVKTSYMYQFTTSSMQDHTTWSAFEHPSQQLRVDCGITVGTTSKIACTCSQSHKWCSLHVTRCSIIYKHICMRHALSSVYMHYSRQSTWLVVTRVNLSCTSIHYRCHPPALVISLHLNVVVILIHTWHPTAQLRSCNIFCYPHPLR